MLCAVLGSLLCLNGLAQYSSGADAPELVLGRALFFDTRLSGNQTQACATCHAPDAGFVDPRKNSTHGAVSLGADGHSLGQRNTPTLGYIALTPALNKNDANEWRGGFFYDGRAATLTDQIPGPIFDLSELALASPAQLVRRLRDSQFYRQQITLAFGSDALSTEDSAVQAVSTSLAAFQGSDFFAPFDSKFDRYRRGEVELSRLEEQGRLLFFSNLVNCNSCHHLNQPHRETFTDYSYHNIGVPANAELSYPPDQGLALNPQVRGTQHQGKFKVPTLRNIMITGPYMHNGVFKDMETVMAFYNKYLMRADINPSTGQPWQPAEVPSNISHELLRQGQPLDQNRIRALIAFLSTLTDARYVHLLEVTGDE